MFRLFIKTILMAGLILLTYLFLWIVPVKPHVIYASILDKHERLSSLAGPRLIFTGGSGIALGLDSELIERKLGTPVVNMGVNAGFGLRYMLDEIRPSLSGGDVVIIVPEYEYFYGSALDGSQNLLWAYQIWGTDIFGRFVPSWGQLRNVALEVPFFMQARFLELVSSREDSIYNRWAFTERGDFVNHLTLPAQEIWPTSITQDEAFNVEILVLLEAFRIQAESQGAKVYLLPPAVIESFYEFEDNQGQIELVVERLRQETQLQLLAEPIKYLLPPKMFFDTVYHLNEEGRQLRSLMIADDLVHALGVAATE